MKKFVFGIVAGALIALTGMRFAMPRLMLEERISPFDFERTIETIEANAKKGGWSVSAADRLDRKLAKHGRTIPPVALVNLCQPDYAADVLADDASRRIAVMMPCTIAVYRKADGKTYVSTMKVGLMGRLFGGKIAEVMGGPVAEDEAGFTAFLERKNQPPTPEDTP